MVAGGPECPPCGRSHGSHAARLEHPGAHAGSGAVARGSQHGADPTGGAGG